MRNPDSGWAWRVVEGRPDRLATAFSSEKNESKHGVSRLEAESAFHDPAYKLFADQKHSTSREKRYLLYGKSLENRVLMVGFTIRRGRVRIITARAVSRKERVIYGR